MAAAAGHRLPARALAVLLAGTLITATGLVVRRSHPAAAHTRSGPGQQLVSLSGPRRAPADPAGALLATNARGGGQESVAGATVARPATLHTADVLVTQPAPLTPAQVARLSRLPAVLATVRLDAGTRPVGAAHPLVIGVDPTEFRPFTPAVTARSTPLWRAVAMGELVASFPAAAALHLPLGGSVPLDGHRVAVAGFADFGVPPASLLVDRRVARTLDLPRGNALLISAPASDPWRLRDEIHQVLGAAAGVALLRPVQEVRIASSGGRVPTPPGGYLGLYRAAARTCPGLSWAVLAAVGTIESGNGVNVGPSTAGALGPMQFMPATWGEYAVDADHDGVANIMSPVDAIYTAARFLCANGAGSGGQGLYDAIFAYNHADWYVRDVLALAQRFGEP